MTAEIRKAAAAAVTMVALLISGTGIVHAEEPTDAPADSPIVLQAESAIADVRDFDPARTRVSVYSAAMDRTVTVDVLHPVDDEPRPTYYLLDGVDSGAAETNWTQKTDIVSFFADKRVNVVLPVGGKGSFYSDWKRPDPALGGAQMWETFLTQELPPLVDAQFHGDGRNVIGGLSMGALSAFTLATRYPELYRGVAAFSGCLDTTSMNAKLAIRNSVRWVGGNPDNMWGTDADPAWQAHDPLTNAAALRGKTVYVSTGSGTPGLESLTDPLMPQAVTFGAALEYLVHDCTESFQRRLQAIDVPATFVFHPQGTHSWPYWQEDLHESWPILEAALVQ
ncbi:alpha/beta hydrolase [Nocardia niigatensis]|uniref:alpha/beta hydrolase n=1 Tax=Nocardia niigatensis TaxID=209249 RepID=UPI0002D425DC|nr:alpha/beta hydrolase family protein [Nocardia niigatensis]